MSFLILLVLGWSGIFANWFVSYKRKRTASTFKQYLIVNIADTIASASAIAGSMVALYQASPALSPLACVTAYLAGYAIDNKLNKDVGAPTIEEIKHADKDKSLDVVLADDRKL